MLSECSNTCCLRIDPRARRLLPAQPDDLVSSPIRDILNIVGSQLECLFMPPQFTLISFQPHNAAMDAVALALHGQEAVSTAMTGRRVIFQGSSQDDHMDAIWSTSPMNTVIGLDNRSIALSAYPDQ